MPHLSPLRRLPHRSVWAAMMTLGISLASSNATDWPQFLGPNRNGSTPDRVVPWPATGPRRLWKQAIGAGFSGPVIRDGRVFVFDREGNEERVRSLDIATGETRWTHRAPTGYVDGFGFDNGPRSTPATTPDRIVTFGAEGRLSCLNLADGRPVWTSEAGKDLGADPGFFGSACSPLIVGQRIILNLGNRGGGGVAAFDLETGKLLWKATEHEAGYASPIPTADNTGIAFFTREGLVLTDLLGTVGATHRWRSRQHASVNAASPLIVGQEIFLTSSYETGGILLRRSAQGLETVWSNDDSLSAHYATPIQHGGFLYGFHGRQERGTELRCVDWNSGKIRWSEPGLGAGTVILAGNQLVLLLESGELLVAEATPEAFKAKERAQILGRGTRAPFAISGGHLAARDPRMLICLGL